MLTIGRHYSGKKRDSARDCDICGVKWHFSELRKNADGHYECPDDQGGRCATDLDAQRAIDSSVPSVVEGRRE